MAILVIGEVPGGSAETDQAIQQAAGVSPSSPPAGALLRLSGPIDGGWRVISVWESEEAWNTFRRDKLEPAFRQMGREGPQVTVSPLHDVRINPSAR